MNGETGQQKVARRTAYILVAFAAVAAASPFDSIPRLHVGPFHLFEFLAGAWAVAAFFSHRARVGGRALIPALLFLLWGCMLAGRDVLFRQDALADPRALARLLQHCALFVYPCLWMAIGVWVARMDRAVVALVILMVLAVNTAPNFEGHVVANLGLGPLTAVVLSVCVDKALSWPRRSAESLAYWLVSAGLAALTFAPYWRLWALRGPMQRTSLLMLLFMLVATPLLRRKNLSAVRTMLVTLPVFLAGFVVATLLTAHEPGMTIGEHLSDNIMASLDKYGGYLDEHPSPLAMVSVRKFWWRVAVEDWRASPVAGAGFIPEVPSRIGEGLPNDWHTVQTEARFQSSAPISGPHNSYLTILARMGAVGLALFALLAAHWVWSVWPLVRGRELNLYEIIVVLLPVNGAIHAFLNIGLESPRECLILWLAAGAASVYAAAIADAEALANARD